MREQQAKDFWSVYLKLILRKGQETTIVVCYPSSRQIK